MGVGFGVGLGMAGVGWWCFAAVGGVDDEKAGDVMCGVDEHLGGESALVAVVIDEFAAVDFKDEEAEAHVRN